MRKSFVAKKEIDALSKDFPEILKIKVVFKEKDGVLHSRYPVKTRWGYGIACSKSGDKNLSLTQPLNLYSNLNSICSFCFDEVSITRNKKLSLNNYLQDLRQLQTIYKHSLQDFKTDVFKFETLNSVTLLKANLESMFKYSFTYRSTYMEGAKASSTAVKNFLTRHEATKKRLEETEETLLNLIRSEKSNNDFLMDIAARLIPVPDYCYENSKAKSLIKDIENMQAKLVADSGWSLFHIVPFSFYNGQSENKLQVVRLEPYKIAENLYYAPQIVFNEVNNEFGHLQIDDSHCFVNPLSQETVENLAGIYAHGTSGNNGRLKTALRVAKLI